MDPAGPPSPTPRSILKQHSLTKRWNITDLTVDINPRPPPTPTKHHSTPSPNTTATTSPGRWRSKEFCFYYAVFIVVVPCMAKVVIDLSSTSHPNYYYFSHRLKKGWIFNWSVDVSDNQWNTIRNNLPLLTLTAIIWLFTSNLVKHFFSNSNRQQLSASQRESFILAFAFPLLIVLHGTSLPKMMSILLVNFAISRLIFRLRSSRWKRVSPLISWTFNLGVLFANEIWEGYRWESLSGELAALDTEWVKGILPRWHINWNITMLRLISFNMDYYWACTSHPPSLNQPQASEKSSSSSTLILDDRARSSTSHPLDAYSLKSYLAYALYPPLYLAGPILTFNSFHSQLLSPPKISSKTLIGYGVRFLVCLGTMELVGHTMYVVAIKDSSRTGAWMGDSPFELSMIGFWNLIVVWLKLLIPWRFFRLWALLDGIDPPENMVRCMANNYSTSGFWRSWHRSYNLWVVRYLYVPIGGGSNAILANLVVFTFVALWHDLSLKLLTWGWVVAVFVLPEMGAHKFIPYSKYGKTSWYRHVAAVGGVFNILTMMTANLIGFAIGTEGMAYMWGQMVGTWEGVQFMVVALACLFVAVQVMFEYREEEVRRGILRRY